MNHIEALVFVTSDYNYVPSTAFNNDCMMRQRKITLVLSKTMHLCFRSDLVRA